MTKVINPILEHEKEDLQISYKPTFHGGEIKIKFSNNQIEVLNSMFNFMNQQTKAHLKHNKEFTKISRAKAAKQRENLKEWEETYKKFSFVAHKIRLKHGQKAQRFFLSKVSKYNDNESISNFISLGRKIYAAKVIESRNKRIFDLVQVGMKKSKVAELFGIKPPTLSNILKKQSAKNQLKLI